MTLTLLLFRWIANKISDILGTEDDVVIELCFNLIEGTRYVSCWNFDTMLARVLLSAADSALQPDIKSLQIQLTGFLDKDTAPFCKDLWMLLLSAQTSPQGVPKELLEAKKLELMQEKVRPRPYELKISTTLDANWPFLERC